MRRTFLIFIFFSFMFCFQAIAKELTFPEEASLPPRVQELFRKHKLDGKYRFSAHINPFFIQGDFDGDRQLDTAVLAIEKASGKKGIVIFHRGTSKVFVIGAGKRFGNGDDDFEWHDAWYAYPKSKVEQGVDEPPPPKLRGDAIYVIKSESASAIIYWDGSRYQWYQQGD